MLRVDLERAQLVLTCLGSDIPGSLYFKLQSETQAHVESRTCSRAMMRGKDGLLIGLVDRCIVDFKPIPIPL